MIVTPSQSALPPGSTRGRLRESIRWGWKTDLAIQLAGDVSLVGGLVLFATFVFGRMLSLSRNQDVRLRKVV